MHDEQLIIGEGEHGMALDYLVALQELAMDYGMPPQKTLAGTGIPLNALIRSNVRIGHKSFSRAVKNVIDEINDPTLAIQYGKRMSMFRHGALGYAFQASQNLAETSELLSKYVDTRSGGGQRFERLETATTVAIIYRSEREEIDEAVERFQFLTLLFNVEYLGRFLTGTLNDAIPTEIHISKPEAGHIPTDILPPGLTIKFDQPINQLIAPKDYFYRPIITADPSIMPEALSQIEYEMLSIESALDIASIIRRKLRDHQGKMPSLPQMSEQMNLSSSSLKRKLKDLGMTYQKIRDAELFHKAIYLLSTTQHTLEQIADALGYGDSSNFTKAFKHWAGLTPNEYRKKYRGE